MGRGWIGWWEGGGGVVVRAGRGEDGRERRRGGEGRAVEEGGGKGEGSHCWRGGVKEMWAMSLLLFTVALRLSNSSHARARDRIETLAHARRATSDHADLWCL